MTAWGRPTPSGYYFGEGGFKVDWQTVVTLSVLNATVVTALLAVGSQAFRRRRSSAV